MGFIQTFTEFKKNKLSEKQEEKKQSAKQKYAQAVKELLSEFGADEIYELESDQRTKFFKKLQELLDTDVEIKEAYELAYGKDTLITEAKDEEEEDEEEEDDDEEDEDEDDDEDEDEEKDKDKGEDDEEEEDDEDYVDESTSATFLRTVLKKEISDERKSLLENLLETFEENPVISDVQIDESGNAVIEFGTDEPVELDLRIEEMTLVSSGNTTESFSLENSAIEDGKLIEGTSKDEFINKFKRILELLEFDESLNEDAGGIIPNPEMSESQLEIYNLIHNKISMRPISEYKKEEKEEEEETNEGEKVECPKCKGEGCDHCDGKGYHLKESADEDEKDDKPKKDSDDESVTVENLYAKLQSGEITLEQFKSDLENVTEAKNKTKNYYTIGGDAFDGGVMLTVFVNDKKVYDDDRVGNHDWEYNKKEYDNIAKLLDAIAKDNGLKSNKDFERIEESNKTEENIEESKIDEKEINSEAEFKEYAMTVLKKAFGDEFEEERANAVINGLTKKYGDKGDWGAAVGALQSGLE